jgi:hypothetical protein
VRAAQESDEKAALGTRFKRALENAASRGCQSAVYAFLEDLKSSVAVICRPVGKVKDLVSSGNELYASFYQLVGAGARRLEGTKMDLERRVSDAIMFPYYEQEIRFASLSLDGLGVTAYGDCSMVLKDVAIADRATVFEENSVQFCKEYKLGVADLLPPGYRATWSDRAMLAVAKLELDSLLIPAPVSSRRFSPPVQVRTSSKYISSTGLTAEALSVSWFENREPSQT